MLNKTKKNTVPTCEYYTAYNTYDINKQLDINWLYSANPLVTNYNYNIMIIIESSCKKKKKLKILILLTCNHLSVL